MYPTFKLLQKLATSRVWVCCCLFLILTVSESAGQVLTTRLVYADEQLIRNMEQALNKNWDLDNFFNNGRVFISDDDGTSIWFVITSIVETETEQIINFKTRSISLKLQGQALPTLLGSFSELERLTIGGSASGEIPASLGNLSKLTWLELDGLGLTGEIPPSLGNLLLLDYLDLSDNALSGQIPETLGNLSALEILYLDENQLTGTPPASLSQLSLLRLLFLRNNQLRGEVPIAWQAFSGYSTALVLDQNCLTLPL